MHTLGSEIAPNRASDLGWFYFVRRILQHVFKTLHRRKSIGLKSKDTNILTKDNCSCIFEWVG